MPIKWGSTTCTVIKWGSTQCAVVYWGSTIVFPGGGGSVGYNGSTFGAPFTSGMICYRYSNGAGYQVVTSGTLQTQANGTSRLSIGANIGVGFGSSSVSLYYTLNLTNYTKCTVFYTSSNTTYCKPDSFISVKLSNEGGVKQCTTSQHVLGSFITYDIIADARKNNVNYFSIGVTHSGPAAGLTTTFKITKIIMS